MLKLVNDKRATGCNYGITAMPSVPFLTWNNLLAASAHSKDVATKNFFAYESSTGKTTADRLNLVG